MKKFFYVALAVIAVGLYSCQKEGTAPNKRVSTSGLSVKGKKDTTPPDFTLRTVKKDTTPPDLTKK